MKIIDDLWIREFACKLSGLHWDSSEIQKWLKANSGLLARVGKSTFRSYLLLLGEGKNELAFQLLLAKMDAEAIIIRMDDNAELMDLYNSDRAKFLSAVMDFGRRILLPRALELALLLI
jgi:hypothetical protein